MLIKEQNERYSSSELNKSIYGLSVTEENQEIIGYYVITYHFTRKIIIYANIFETQDFNFKLLTSELPTRTINFIGREIILKQIEKNFFELNKQIVVVSSFSGTGKTTVANEFGYQFLEKNPDSYAYWMKSDENNDKSD